MNNEYLVYTDGSCLGNPGPGGWATVVVPKEGEPHELFGGDLGTTNNRMELKAAAAGLQVTPRGAAVTLVTDSGYLKKAFTDGWLAKWRRNGWATATGAPVKNRDLWEILDGLVSERRVSFKWVKGHAGHPLNERCDRLARAAAARAKARAAGR